MLFGWQMSLMKLNILSDLHLSCGALEMPRNDADIVILAGDIARPKDAVSWALGFAKPVLYVPGNHEFYGGSIVEAAEELKKLCAGTNIHVLDNDQVTIDGVRFLGTTLWTDFMHGTDDEQRSRAMQEAQRFMRDFSIIRVDDPVPRLFTPVDAAALCRADAQWLENRLAEPHAGPTVVITHHAPSRQSIHSRFAGSLLNGCFVSDLQHLVDGQRVQLWVHGHTHDTFDYMLHGTRVVCNPRGYAKEGVNENLLFDSNFVVQFGPSTQDGELE
ncbi:3',5'-cyclic adenosine monophosphate phosphodiesterase CpdA [mine drainage metagenome]|uniref:3',5'-cyclic adenosine monophosphate phosphodiesterase CpdA n=1 Tax=mine drainage metagenome TaxID=410659 RepID=A0A1J5Q2K3_9ZZZZ